jgi:hypothetical protein
MAKATRVHSTPPTNTPIDTTRRRFLAVSAGASVATLAVAAMPATARGACAADPAFALIAEKLAADIAHCEAIDEQDVASGFATLIGFPSSLRPEAVFDVGFIPRTSKTHTAV